MSARVAGSELSMKCLRTGRCQGRCSSGADEPVARSRNGPVDGPTAAYEPCPHMRDKRTDVLYGRFGLIILKTLEALGPLHEYRIARQIE